MADRKLQGRCIDCGRKYGDEHGFPDLVVPDWAWKELSPTGGSGGLLCPSCLCRFAHHAGVECEARFASGPFRPQEPRAKTLDDIVAFKAGGVLPEIICPVHGRIGSKDGSCPKCQPIDQVEAYKALYLDLIYQVANRHPGESRHDTAKRYITQAENHPVQCAAAGESSKARGEQMNYERRAVVGTRPEMLAREGYYRTPVFLRECDFQPWVQSRKATARRPGTLSRGGWGVGAAAPTAEGRKSRFESCRCSPICPTSTCGSDKGK